MNTLQSPDPRPKAQDPKTGEPHSAACFGPQRDHWWNRDFLDLMARRWRLDQVSSIADIGCGVGHWSRLLYPYLKAPAQLAGVDREARWVTEGERRFREAFPQVAAELVKFHQGDATAIPLPDASFDVVTAQTLLMHLPDPIAALREMLRIVRPGGLLICAEPNNFWGYLSFTSLTAGEPLETLTQRFEFWLRCHRGRMAGGAGDQAMGDLLPGYFAQLGVQEIAVHVCDRAASLFPPYDQPAQQALIEQERQWHATGTGPWDRETFWRDYQAGGGDRAGFERGWANLEKRFRDEQAAMADGTFHAALGALHYLVSGRKARCSLPAHSKACFR